MQGTESPSRSYLAQEQRRRLPKKLLAAMRVLILAPVHETNLQDCERTLPPRAPNRPQTVVQAEHLLSYPPRVPPALSPVSCHNQQQRTYYSCVVPRQVHEFVAGDLPGSNRLSRIAHMIR